MGFFASLKKFLFKVSPTWYSIGSLPGRSGIDKDEEMVSWQDPLSQIAMLLGKAEAYQEVGEHEIADRFLKEAKGLIVKYDIPDNIVAQLLSEMKFK